MGNIKGAGHIYQQTFIDKYTKVATVKLYDRKVALVAADMLYGRVIPLYDQYGIPLMRVLIDRGTEYCGASEHHEYQLYPVIKDINHTKTKARSPQTNCICEPFHQTMQDELYVTAFRKSFTKRSKKDNLHLTKEKLLDTLNQNFVSMTPSD